MRYAIDRHRPCGTGTAVTSTSAMRVGTPGASGIARPCGFDVPGSGRMRVVEDVVELLLEAGERVGARRTSAGACRGAR